jgi:hypothetical protein
MEDSEPFLQSLEGALEKRRQYLDTVRLPQVKEAFRSLQTLFETLFNMLIRKGLLREDPYKYDRQITEISAPSDDPLTESEKRDEVSYRLSAYRSQLDYLTNYYQFSADFLNLSRLKRVSALLGYITWTKITEGAKSPTTRAFAQYLTTIKMGTDSMATGIVKDSLAQIEKTLHQIHAGMAEVVTFHRESFKCSLRGSALPRLGMDPAAAAARHDEAARALKRAFAQACPGQPYYPELAEEVLAEEYGEDGRGRRARLLEALAIKEEKKQAVSPKEAPHKELLLEAVRLLARCGGDLSSALESLSANSLAASQKADGLGARLRRWLARGGAAGRDEQVYDVEYMERESGARKAEKVAFGPFVESVQRKATLYASLANRASAASHKMEGSAEDQILEFVGRQLADLNIMHRRMNGLNTYFLSEATRETRASMKGIKIQLTAIHNAIVKANQKKHDYVARREEQEQMRRMGIQ